MNDRMSHEEVVTQVQLAGIRARNAAEEQRDALAAELEHLRDVARNLLALKDGPRDAAYYAGKESAWSALRTAVQR